LLDEVGVLAPVGVILYHSRVCSIEETRVILSKLLNDCDAVPSWVACAGIDICNVLVAEESDAQFLVMTHLEKALEVIGQGLGVALGINLTWAI
jgi:hypothetical protein